MPKSSKKVVSVTHQPYKLIKSGRVSKPLRSSGLSMNRNLFLQNLKPRKKGSPSKDGSLSPPPAVAIVDPSNELIESGNRDAEEQVVFLKKLETFDDTFDGILAVEKNKFDTKTPNKPQTPAATLGSNYMYMGNLRRCIDERRIHSFFKDTGKVVSVRLLKSDRRLFAFAHVRFETTQKVVSVTHQPYKLIKSGRVSKPLRSSVLSKNHNLFLQNLKPRKKGSPSKDGSLSPPAAVAILKQKTFDDTSDGLVAVEKNKFDTNTPNKPQSPAATPGSNYVYMGNLSLGIKEETILDFFKNIGKVVSVRLHESDRRLFCFAHVRFDTSETAQKALKCNRELLCGYPVEMFLVHDEMPDLDVDPHSKLYEYLFMDNLSPSTRINDVLEFFKDSGEIELVRFDKCWGRFSGSGYIQFSTPEEARKGLERNREKLLGHAVELVLTTHAIASIGLTPNWRKVGSIGRGYGPTTCEER